MSRRFAKEVFAYGVVTALAKSFTILLLPIYSRCMSVEQLGVLELLGSSLRIAVILAMLQLESAIGRYFYLHQQQDERKRDISTSVITALLFSGVLSLLVCLTWLLVVRESEEFLNVNSEMIILFACTLPFSALNGLFVSVFRYLRTPVTFGIFSCAQLLLTLLLSISLVVYGQMGVEGVLISELLGLAIPTVVMGALLMKKRLLALQWSKEAFTRLTLYSAPQIPGAISGWGQLYVNRYVLILFASIHDVGLFSAAVRVAAIVKLFEEAVKMCWGPFVFEKLNDPQHAKTFQKVFMAATQIVSAGVTLAVAIGPEFLGVFLPSDYESSFKMAYVLLLANAFQAVVQIVAIGPSITKRTHLNSIQGVAVLGLNTLTLFLCLPVWGVSAAPWCFAFVAFVSLFVSWRVCESVYPIDFPFLHGVGSLSCATVMVGVLSVDQPSLLARLLLAAVLLITQLTIALHYLYREGITIRFRSYPRSSGELGPQQQDDCVKIA